MGFLPSFTSNAKVQRWPLVAFNLVRVSPSRRVRALGLVLAVALLLGALGPWGWPISGTVRALLAASALLPLCWGFMGMLVTARAPSPTAHVVASATGVARVTGDVSKPLLHWDAPFGVLLLASYGRRTALLAFTTPTQTRYVPARIDERTDADDEVLARVAILADLDLVDAVAHEAALSSAATADLVRHIGRRDAAALGRVYLSDGGGLPIALDRGTLSVGDRTFDLTGQLEWRPLMFHESSGQAAALYQATWIRQNGSEIVLVAPMPASLIPRGVSARRSSEATGRLGRTLTRDLKLLQAPAESPPSRDMRVAIDRPFMMSVRRFLDEAPLASRVPPIPSPPRDKLSAYS